MRGFQNWQRHREAILFKKMKPDIFRYDLIIYEELYSFTYFIYPLLRKDFYFNNNIRIIFIDKKDVYFKKLEQIKPGFIFNENEFFDNVPKYLYQYRGFSDGTDKLTEKKIYPKEEYYYLRTSIENEDLPDYYYIIFSVEKKSDYEYIVLENSKIKYSKNFIHWKDLEDA